MQGLGDTKNESDIQFCFQSIIRFVWRVHSLIRKKKKSLLSAYHVLGIVQSTEDSKKV